MLDLLEWLRKYIVELFTPKAPGKVLPFPTPPPPEPPKASRTQLGIDVSHHNGRLNWPAIAASGVTFAFCKATEGTGFVDSEFLTNVREARKAGIAVGAYHFFRPNLDGLTQAKHFLQATLGIPLDLPAVLDWEAANGISASTQIVQATRWLAKVEDAFGSTPIIYTGPSYFADVVGSPPGFDRYPLWVAHYTAHTIPRVPLPWKAYTFWQYTETGTLSQVPGKQFDLNRYSGPEFTRRA